MKEKKGRCCESRKEEGKDVEAIEYLVACLVIHLFVQLSTSKSTMATVGPLRHLLCYLFLWQTALCPSFLSCSLFLFVLMWDELHFDWILEDLDVLWRFLTCFSEILIAFLIILTFLYNFIIILAFSSVSFTITELFKISYYANSLQFYLNMCELCIFNYLPKIFAHYFYFSIISSIIHNDFCRYWQSMISTYYWISNFQIVYNNWPIWTRIARKAWSNSSK